MHLDSAENGEIGFEPLEKLLFVKGDRFQTKDRNVYEVEGVVFPGSESGAKVAQTYIVSRIQGAEKGGSGGTRDKDTFHTGDWPADTPVKPLG